MTLSTLLLSFPCRLSSTKKKLYNCISWQNKWNLMRPNVKSSTPFHLKICMHPLNASNGNVKQLTCLLSLTHFAHWTGKKIHQCFLSFKHLQIISKFYWHYQNYNSSDKWISAHNPSGQIQFRWIFKMWVSHFPTNNFVTLM